MRSYIGFDRLWSMQIPVPYSLFLRDGAFGWSCGQCPLDRAGQVVAPGDALAQADLVARYCQTLLSESGFQPSDLRMAVVYHDTPDPAPLLHRLQAALGPSLYIPVKVPEFYYPGMVIEVDLFAMADTPHPLRFAMGPQPDTLIDHHLAPPGTPGLPPHAITAPTAQALTWTIAAPGPVTETFHSHHGVTVRLRQSGPFHALTATAGHIPGIVPQTEAIMQAFAETLSARNLTFSDVVKSTTHYTGQATAEELHDNMAVRNRRYSSPGPASTGIRVAGLADTSARTAITLLACRN